MVTLQNLRFRGRNGCGADRRSAAYGVSTPRGSRSTSVGGAGLLVDVGLRHVVYIQRAGVAVRLHDLTD